jgi:enterochelin esterase-like enzyme
MSRFRTLELSDPRYESQHLRQITLNSPALKGRGDITVFVPPGKHRELPLVLLLHGVYGSHWGWTGSGGVHQTALRMIDAGEIRPMVLAMPSDGLWRDGSGYLKHHSTDFESWIVDDVPEAVRELIPQAGKDAPLFISGLSMGGFGALRLGAAHPGRFKAFSAHSSITALSQMESYVEKMPDVPDQGVLEVMLKHKGSLPPFRFDCGTEDVLLPHNRSLSAALKMEGIAHRYEEFAGDHNWAYWAEHVADSLRFFEAVLK